jgi:signal transduction histidine kinase
MKVRTRLLLLIFGFFLTIIAIYSAVIYYSLSQYSYEDFYKRLEIRAITTAKINLDDNRQDSEAIIELRRKYLERLDNERHYIFRKGDAAQLKKAAEYMNVPARFLERVNADRSAYYNRRNVFYCAITYNEHIVLISATSYYTSHQLKYLGGIIWASIVGVLLFVFLFSWLVTRYIFRPISRITSAVNLISTEKLNHRLESGNRDDELGELTRTFNNMLDRLETSFETQNNFISNASHELRTPLTSIIGIAEVTLSKERQPKDYIEALEVVSAEAEKLERKTQALLFLAQTGFTSKRADFTRLRIDEVLMEAVATSRKIYPDCRIETDLEMLPESPEKLKVNGNEQLLHLALTNIIGNGCKYSHNGSVRISIGASDENIVIVVKDDGIGIPKGELRYIYDPFFRASNTTGFEGYGIGLPLTRNIVKMHRGKLLVTSIEQGGTTVQVKLPVA